MQVRLSTADAQPLYAQVQQMLLGRIRRRYMPGDLLPTQQELAKETGASLITIKRAINELARRGVVESVRGRGTIVRRPVVADDHGGVSSWTGAMTDIGVAPSTAWTRIEVRTPPANVSRLLGLKSRERTVRVTRLRLADGQPICLMNNELPLALVPDLPQCGMDRESMYELLRERYRLRPSCADEQVWSRAGTASERRMLACESGIVLVIERQTFLRDGSPLELSSIIAPAERYRYRVRLSARG